MKTKSKGDLIIISGTTCAGKGTVIKKLLANHNDIVLSTSYTSRPKRESEIDGVDYYFVSQEEFENKIKNGDFLEYAQVQYGAYYGTPKKEVLELLDSGKDVILEIDVQGAKQIKELYPETILIFIMAPSMREVKRRIMMRGDENIDQIISRFKVAYNEINQINNYNYVVVNDDLDNAVAKVEAILVSEKLRVDRIEELSVENEEEIIHELLMDKEFVNEKNYE
ncbi:MAG TPA: guanylate kinase [Candidatus Onthocola stercoravium]|nr:guanylate kinase [Candidatus Onthocola stercoravium]